MSVTRIAIATLAMLVLAGCAGPRPVRRGLPPPLMSTLSRRPLPGRVPAARPSPVTPRPRRYPIPHLTRPVTIIVDAGHGGHDPGALGLGPVPEKTVNLNIAKRLARLLEDCGAMVITTRDTDTFISLDGRVGIAERNRADLFVSVHADSGRRASAAGATVYIARGASRQSRHAAESIAAALENANVECRGIQRAGFRVLIGHSRPAVLVECGFLTNRSDARRLSTPAYQARIAAAIARGIVDHFTP